MSEFLQIDFQSSLEQFVLILIEDASECCYTLADSISFEDRFVAGKMVDCRISVFKGGVGLDPLPLMMFGQWVFLLCFFIHFNNVLLIFYW